MQFDDYRTINTQIFAYGEMLRDFVDEYNLPEEWFMLPDHIAFKCRNADHFDEIIRLANDDAEQLVVVNLEGRNIASALLDNPVYVESFGSVEWLEIIQPRIEKQGEDLVGIEHLEFYWTDLESVEDILHDRGITYELQHHDTQQGICIEIDEFGHEVKLSGRRLATIAQIETDNNDIESIL